MKYITLLILLTTASAFADFAPENKKKIPIRKNTSMAETGIDQATFNNIITSVNNFYKPEVAAHGANLIIKRLWANATVNSSTDVEDTNWVINAYGGLARYPNMTADGYLMVLCHEVGHHLGGYPKSGLSTWRTNLTTHWASNEGQSDYFAVMKCFRKMVQDDPNNRFYATAGRSARAKVCAEKTPNEAAVCTRSVNAGMVLAGVLHDLSGANEPFKLSLSTPDKTIVKKTYDDHPNSQCRLDTYYNAAICDAPFLTPFSTFEPTAGACSEEAGDVGGVRPRCWYKPRM